MTDTLNGLASSPLAIDCLNLSFSFAEGSQTVLKGVDLQLGRGARCLLVGANGGPYIRRLCTPTHIPK